MVFVGISTDELFDEYKDQVVKEIARAEEFTKTKGQKVLLNKTLENNVWYDFCRDCISGDNDKDLEVGIELVNRIDNDDFFSMSKQKYLMQT